MKQKLIITTLAICIITISSLSANAYNRGGGGYGPPAFSESEWGENDWRKNKRHSRHEMMNELLGLSEEQLEQIKVIREEERTTNENLREKMHEYREQMRELTDTGSFDENAVRKIAEEKAEIQVEMAVSRARMHSKIHAIMSPEQQELAKKIRSLRHNKKGKKHRGRGDRW